MLGAWSVGWGDYFFIYSFKLYLFLFLLNFFAVTSDQRREGALLCAANMSERVTIREPIAVLSMTYGFDWKIWDSLLWCPYPSVPSVDFVFQIVLGNLWIEPLSRYRWFCYRLRYNCESPSYISLIDGLWGFWGCFYPSGSGLYSGSDSH